MQTGLAGKVVLITGATRNHGRASALAFAEEGGAPAPLYASEHGFAGRDRAPGRTMRGESRDGPV